MNGPACAAADSALYFRPDGYVMACCGGWHPLGRVTGPQRQSIREIWDGAAAHALRQALRAADFRLGCWECGRFAASGRRRDSLAADFDRYQSNGPLRNPAMMDFALSNRCNLACVMCNGGLSSTIRAQREGRPPLPAAYDDRFFEELGDFLPHLQRAQFKGGEPFLAPENRRIWDELLRVDDKPEVSVTTNGTVWSDSVDHYIRALRMQIIVSVDAISDDVLRATRVGVDPRRLWQNIDRLQRATEDSGLELTLSFCLMAHNWRELGPFLTEVDRRGAKPDVIWVDGPGRFDLLGSPHLREVHAELEAESPRRAGLSGPGRAIWREVLDRVSDRLTQSQTSSVRIGTATSERMPRAAPSLDALRWELSRSSNLPLLQITYHDEVIAHVNAPEWASWLDPSSLIGVGLDETMTRFALASADPMWSAVETGDEGIHRAELWFEGPGRRCRLDAIFVPASQDARTSHLLVALTHRTPSHPA